jgi:predicted HTH domain antitoxin
MSESQIEVKFVVPLNEIPEKHRIAAQRQAHKAFVMELLRQGDISAGRAARLLNLNRSQLSKLMYEYNISPFDDTMTLEELQQEVSDCIQMLEKKCHQ